MYFPDYEAGYSTKFSLCFIALSVSQAYVRSFSQYLVYDDGDVFGSWVDAIEFGAIPHSGFYGRTVQ